MNQIILILKNQSPEIHSLMLSTIFLILLYAKNRNREIPLDTVLGAFLSVHGLYSVIRILLLITLLGWEAINPSTIGKELVVGLLALCWISFNKFMQILKAH